MLTSGERLADRSLADLLAQVAARRPAPGGGTSAALACALAAGLVEMTAAFTEGGSAQVVADEPMRSLGRRASELRAMALQLAERELHSYAPVLEALRLDAADPEREGRLGAALSEAAEAPLAIARAAAEVAELGAEALAGGSQHLRGDAVTGVLLAEAACRSAGRLVDLNLARLPQDARSGEVRRLAERGDMARRRALDGD